MARIEDSYPTPIHGVSTLAPRNRARGQAGVQLNMRSDPVAKLTRRPSLSWDVDLLTTTAEVAHHSYYRRERDFQIIIEDDGTVHGYVDGVKKTVTGDLSTYITTTDLVLETINDTTFVVDKSVVAAMLPATDASSIQQVSHINVTTALAYSTDLVINVGTGLGPSLGIATISIGDGIIDIPGDDAARATNAVALEIARQINDGTTSTVDVPNPDYTGDAAICSPTVPDPNYTAGAITFVELGVLDAATMDATGATAGLIAGARFWLDNIGTFDVTTLLEVVTVVSPTRFTCKEVITGSVTPFPTSIIDNIGGDLRLQDGACDWVDNGSFDPLDTECLPYLTNPTGIDGVTAVATGSSVAVYRTSGDYWLALDVDAGRADNAVAINEVVERVDGLPLYAIPGTRITVKPDPTSADGTYYLDAVTLIGNLTGNMQEVVWTETRSPDEPYGIDSTTMPHTILYDYDTDEFTVSAAPLGWADRDTGDNESVPLPDFIGRGITALSQFQKRLVLISDNDVSMTRTDDLYDWWKRSAVNLLVTDPIGVTSNSTGIDILQYVVEHNRDLLIIASNGQFKIEGVQGITPQTVAMPLTTSQEIQVTVPPVSMGSAVYLPINYGESTGIARYTGNRDQQDTATPITHHVIGYMPGEAKIFVGSPNLEMLALTTTTSAQNEIFIFEQFKDQSKITQQSWSTWTLPVTNEIIAMNFRRDSLSVIVKVGNCIIQKSLNMYSRVATNTHEVFLDDFLTLSTDGLTATVPVNYDITGFVVVMGEGTAYPLETIPYVRVGDVLTFSEDIGAGSVYVGTPFRSAYRPTRPFVEDDKGIAVTTDRVRIGKFILNVVDTERVFMNIDSEYYSGDDQENSPRILNRSYNRIGIVDLFTGDYKFSFSQDADLAEAEFYTEGFLGMTIAGISWEGQYNKSSGRMS